MRRSLKPFIGITLGDAAGIGPEITAKTAAKGILTKKARPVIIGDEGLFRLGMKTAGVKLDYRVIQAPETGASAQYIRSGIEAAPGRAIVLLDTRSVDLGRLKLGEASAANGKEEGDRLVQCVNYCKQGVLDGFCFAPLNKAALKAGGYNFPSEHELFAHEYGTGKYSGEMNVLDNLWNIRVTSHIPLRDVAQSITRDRILETAALGEETLRRAGVKKPRFVLAALNPHAGDNGSCGDEEITVLAPVVKDLRERGMNISGPYPADTLFIRAFNGDFDGVITLFHDQGQIAIKLKGFARAVTVAAGLPHPITTPAHGTAYDIAGKGVAKASTFEAAYLLCAKMAGTRAGSGY